MWWGRISDKIGRKPVLIGGLIGTLISMVVFGFAKSFPIALLARAGGGLLNGNIGVIQTTLAEMVPQQEHQRKHLIMRKSLHQLTVYSQSILNHTLRLVYWIDHRPSSRRCIG